MAVKRTDLKFLVTHLITFSNASSRLTKSKSFEKVF